MYARLALFTLLLALVVAQSPPRPLESSRDRDARSKPVYRTVITKGDANLPLGPTRYYDISSGKCSGAVSLDLCKDPTRAARVEIVMNDYVEGGAGSIADDMWSATLTRVNPCKRRATIHVRVGCK